MSTIRLNLKTHIFRGKLRLFSPVIQRRLPLHFVFSKKKYLELAELAVVAKYCMC